MRVSIQLGDPRQKKDQSSPISVRVTSMHDAGPAFPFTVRVRQLAEPNAVDNLAKRTILAVVMVAMGGARSAGRPARIVGSQQVRSRTRESQGIGLPAAG